MFEEFPKKINSKTRNGITNVMNSLNQGMNKLSQSLIIENLLYKLFEFTKISKFLYSPPAEILVSNAFELDKVF